MDRDSDFQMYRDLYVHHEAALDIIAGVPGAPTKGPIKDRVQWLAEQLAKAKSDAHAAIERQEAENGRQAAALAEARRRLVEVTNERDRIAEELTLLDDSQADIHAALKAIREAGIEQTLGRDAVDVTTVNDLARACRMDRSVRPEANAVMRAAVEEIWQLRSAYNTAAQRADSNAQRRAEAAYLHGVLDDVDIGFGPLRNRVEALVRMVQTAEAPRKGLDAEVDRALAQLDAAGFDVADKGLGALEDALVKMSKLERDAERLRGELQGVVAESTTLLDSHRREREKIVNLLDAHGFAPGTLAERVTNALLKPPATIDVIIDPGHVENAQARAMLAERFTAKMNEPLKFEEQVGLTIEYTSYGTVRVTQHVDVKGHRAAAARIADLEDQLEQARRLTQTHVERSEERYKAACEANDEVRRLKLAVVTLGRCAVELAGGDPRNV